ncbi:peptide deformylase, partial [candidate division KSB1 bacterium]|nr:peptide deformylase [candidate division KSB1 bacterium]
ILDEMVNVMVTHNGIGLAAPQIGISQRLITVMLNDQLFKVVNPQITWQNEAQDFEIEGCLSIPNEFYIVSRMKKIMVKGLNPEGKEITIVANNLLARVFQHEIDHLDGILINSKGERYKDSSLDIAL